MKINNIRGDLTDASAKKEALVVRLNAAAHLSFVLWEVASLISAHTKHPLPHMPRFALMW